MLSEVLTFLKKINFDLVDVFDLLYSSTGSLIQIDGFFVNRDFYDQKIIGDLTTSINNIINNYTEAVKKNKIAKKNLQRFTFNNIKKFEYLFDKVLSN